MDTMIQDSQRSRGSRLGLSFRKYAAVLRVSVANNLAYLMEVFFRALFLIVLMFILTQLWKATFASRGKAVLGGFDVNDIIWYIAVAEVLATSLPPLTRRIDQEVRSGQLAYLLGRPCSYVLYHFAQYLGERLVRLSINAVVAALLALILVGLPHFTWMGALAFPLVGFLAISIDFLAYFGIGLLAFWTEDTQSFTLIYNRLVLVLGGVLIPLEIFPEPLRTIAQALPFSAILYGPSRTLVRFELDRFAWLLAQQASILIVGGIILFAIYRVALRRVNMNGG